MFNSVLYYNAVPQLLTCGKNLHEHITSLRGEVWAHTTSLTPPLYIEVAAPNQESERSCIYVLGILIFPLSTILIFDLRIDQAVWYLLFFYDFRIVLTVWYLLFFMILELF